MYVRLSSMALAGTLAVVPFLTAAGAQADQSRQVARSTEMVPLIAVSRVTSPDRTFIVGASNSAIKTMNTSKAEIDTSRLGSVQGEAVRAFNTAAYAYNKLADIASDRRIQVASPNSLFTPDVTPNLVDGAPIRVADVRYLNMRPASLARTIAIYADEVKNGQDPIVVGFARQMKARLEHDLVLATLGLKSLDSGGYGDRPAETDGSSTIL